MLMLWVIVLILLLLLILSTSRADLLSPSVLMLFGYLVGAISFLLMQSKWMIDFGTRPFIVELVGLLSFIIPSIIFQFVGTVTVANNPIKRIPSRWKIQIESEHYYWLLLIVTVFAQILITVIVFKQIRQISGASTLSESISSYRTALSDSGSERISGLVSVALKVALAMSLAFVYYAFRAFEDKNKTMYSLVPILLAMIQQILLGGRLQVLRIVLMSIFLYYISERQRSNWSFAGVRNIVKVTCIIILIAAPSFYGMKFVLGRASTESLIPYILRYIGGSTGAFAIFINNGITHSQQFGQETFMGIYDFIGRHSGQNGLVSLPWAVSGTGFTIGNVFGANRRFMADFGLPGVVILNGFMGTFYGFFYGKVRLRLKFYGYSPICETVYSYLLFTCFFQFVEGYFYFSIITVNSFAQIILTIIAVYVVKYISKTHVSVAAANEVYFDLIRT